MVPVDVTWRVCEPMQVAVLDQRFTEDVAALPGVVGELLGRFVARANLLAFQAAIGRIPRVEVRLLCLLWRLADRWGIVRRDGVVLSLKLSQRTLADLTLARRQSVSTAMGALVTKGLVSKDSGRWVLHGEPPGELSAPGGQAAVGYGA